MVNNLFQVTDIEEFSKAVLSDLNGYSTLQRAVDNLKHELKDSHVKQFDSWVRETQEAVKTKTLR